MFIRTFVPAREARAVELVAGTVFRVVDVEGGQVADLFAFARDDCREYQSAEHTRMAVNRLFPQVGEAFVTNRRRPILRFDADTSPGTHDMLCAACDPTRYLALGGEGDHASCEQNLRAAMRVRGCSDIDIPQPINLFMNIPITAASSTQSTVTIGWKPAQTSAGDYAQFCALLDTVIVVSACPQDLVPINAHGPRPLAIEVL